MSDPLSLIAGPSTLRPRFHEADMFAPIFASLTRLHFAMFTGKGKDSRVCKICSSNKVKKAKAGRMGGEIEKDNPRSVWKCSCGITVCNPSYGRPCWLAHMLFEVTPEMYQELHTYLREGEFVNP